MPSESGFTTVDLARRYRVSSDRVRQWIRDRLLSAVNTSPPGLRPRFVITPEALGEFEKVKAAAAPLPRRRRRASKAVEHFPDLKDW